jgi:hypothetical protein
LPEQQEWQRLHAVIFRATHEKAAERFRDFQTFGAAVEGTSEPVSRRKRGIIPHDTTGANLELALASPKWSTADTTVVEEIKSAIKQIKDRLDPK